MTVENTFVVVNPRASGRFDRSLLEALSARSNDPKVCETERPGDARRLARRAADEGFDLVVAAGGDGTVNEVVSGLVGSRRLPSLGVLPLGTGNDLARSFGLPIDPLAAAELLSGCEHERTVDLARVTGGAEMYMANASVSGLGGRIERGLDPVLKRMWGPGVYLRMAIDEIGSASSYLVTLTLDEATVRLEATSVIVANGRYLGGGIPVAPEARLDDGLLDVIVVPKLPALRLLRLVPVFLAARQLERPEILFQRARRVGVEAVGGIPTAVDGETIGSAPTTYDVMPAALRIAAPLS